MLCCENISTRLSQQLSAIIIMIICYVHIKAKGSDEITKIKQHQMNADHAPVKAPQSCVIGNLNQLINISQERRAFENSSKLFNSFRKLQTKKPNTKARRCLDSILKGETWTHTVPNEIENGKLRLRQVNAMLAKTREHENIELYENTFFRLGFNGPISIVSRSTMDTVWPSSWVNICSTKGVERDDIARQKQWKFIAPFSRNGMWQHERSFTAKSELLRLSCGRKVVDELIWCSHLVKHEWTDCIATIYGENCCSMNIQCNVMHWCLIIAYTSLFIQREKFITWMIIFPAGPCFSRRRQWGRDAKLMVNKFSYTFIQMLPTLQNCCRKSRASIVNK